MPRRRRQKNGRFAPRGGSRKDGPMAGAKGKRRRKRRASPAQRLTRDVRRAVNSITGPFGLRL